MWWLWSLNLVIKLRSTHNLTTNQLLIGVPKEFYHEIHRPAHFLTFATMEENENAVEADVDDLYT